MTSAALLFDLDGTLIDSRRDLATGINLMRHDLGLAPLATAQIVGYVGDGLRVLVERSLADAAAAPVDRAVELARRRYVEHIVDETTLYPGALEALEALRLRGYRTAVVTNKPAGPAELVCQRLGLTPYLDAILGGGSCPTLKPDPEPLHRALELTGATTEGSWMIGDNHTDLAAGRRAGLSRCYCRFGFGDPGEEPWDLAIDALDQLVVALP